MGGCYWTLQNVLGWLRQTGLGRGGIQTANPPCFLYVERLAKCFIYNTESLPFLLKFNSLFPL